MTGGRYVKVSKIKVGWWLTTGENEDVPELQVRAVISHRNGGRTFMFMEGGSSGYFGPDDEIRSRPGNLPRQYPGQAPAPSTRVVRGRGVPSATDGQGVPT